MKSKLMAVLISTLTCLVVALITLFMELWTTCLNIKIFSTIIIVLWITIYLLVEPKGKAKVT